MITQNTRKFVATKAKQRAVRSIEIIGEHSKLQLVSLTHETSDLVLFYFPVLRTQRRYLLRTDPFVCSYKLAFISESVWYLSPRRHAVANWFARHLRAPIYIYIYIRSLFLSFLFLDLFIFYNSPFTLPLPYFVILIFRTYSYIDLKLIIITCYVI